VSHRFENRNRVEGVCARRGAFTDVRQVSSEVQ
jgi:hypothetical protein